MAGTIQQIAELAGVSRGTVDRALNNRGRINPEVAKKIEQIADEIGYVPKHRKKADSTGKQSGRGKRVGVVMKSRSLMPVPERWQEGLKGFLRMCVRSRRYSI